MKSLEVSPKALTAWLACAMLGPVALAAAGNTWLAVLITGTLCSLLCVTIHAFSDSRLWGNKLYSAVLLVWHIYAAAIVAGKAGICWPGRGAEVVVPLVLLALAGLSAWNGAERASRVVATLCPLCVLIFAIVLASGIGTVRWNRLSFSPAAPGGELIFVFLLPISATAIPRLPGAAIGRCLTGILAFAVLTSLAVVGTLSLPVALSMENGFYEFAKSIRIFSAVQRFESIAAVAVTVSIYGMLSLLLGSVGHLGEQLSPGKGKWAIGVGAAACAGILAGKLYLEGRSLAVLALLVWGVLPLIAQLLPGRKKSEKNEKKA